jgi:hypothetical protein
LQVLRKGFAETAIWSEARIDGSQIALGNSVGAGVAGSTSHDPDKELNIRFNNCSPFKVDAIAESLLVASYAAGVTVGTEVYSGAWHCVSVGTKIEDDGSGTVSLRIARPTYTLQGYEDFGTERAQDVYYIADVPKDLAQGVLTAWKIAHPIGSSASCSYSRDQKLVNITLRVRAATQKTYLAGIVKLDCRYSDELTIYMGVATPDLYQLPAVTDGMGISYDRLPTSNGDGTWDIRITKRTVKYRDVTGLTIEQNADQSTVQRQQLGLTVQAMEPMLETTGVMKTQRVEVKDDCSKDVTTNAETGKPKTTREVTVARSHTDTTEQKTYQPAALPAPVQTVGKIITAKSEESKYPGKFDTTQKTREINAIQAAVEYDSEDDAGSHGRTVEDIGKKNVGGVSVVLSAASGEALQAAILYDKESDTLDVRRLAVTGKEQISTRSTSSGDALIVETGKTYQGAQLPSATPVAGQVLTNENRQSKFTGKVDTVQTIETGLPQTSRKSTVSGSESVTIEEKTVQAALLPDATPTPGVVVSVENLAGKYPDRITTRQTIETGIAQTDTTKLLSAGSDETVVEKTYQAAPLVDPTPVVGHVKQVRNSQSKYPGKYDTMESDKEAKPLNSVSKGGGVLFDEETEVHKNAAADLSAGTPGIAGQIIDNASQKNDAGLFDNVTKKRTAKPLGPITDIHGTPLVEETVEKSVNQSAPPSPGIPAAGTSVDVQHDINGSGKIDVSKTTRRGIAYSIGPAQTGGDAFSTEQTTIKGNQGSITETFAPGTVKRVDVRVTDLKLLDATVQERTPIAVVDGPLTIHDDGYRKVTRTVHRNVPASIPATAKGHETDFTRNGFNTFDGQETQTTVTEFYIDIQEPATSGKHPGFQRVHFGLLNSASIQAAVDLFVAKAAAIVDEQFTISVSPSRDNDGFYTLHMSASPKQSGGSVAGWDAGLSIVGPECEKRSVYPKIKTSYQFSANRTTAQTFINSGTNPVEGTDVVYIGRGRYKAILCEGIA